MSPFTVNLEVAGNTQPEGLYGFRIVAQSGAGLSKGPPVAGDAPELRVHVDLSKPVLKLWSPTPDPSRRDTLILTWEAQDSNLADRPIALEWSDSPNGRWRAITPEAGNAGGAISTVGYNAPVTTRIPNTGRFAWRVPADMPTHRVYLRVRAVDLAGNEGVVATPEPIQIDLNKPEARIQGIVGTPARRIP